MTIQWYPGHMHKASKEIKGILPQIDLIIEILDARLPFSSQNPMLTMLRGDKPCIKILNKSDLADPEITREWQTYLEQQHAIKTLALSIEQPEKIRLIIDLCHSLLARHETSSKLRNALIVGIPNVGKSTLINSLAGRAIAKTGNEPAITKMQQRINLGDNLMLIDTPGLLWPNLENKNSAYRLAATGGIKDTAIKHDDIALFVAEFLLRHYPDAMKTRFQLGVLPDTEHELLETIGKKRGCLKAGGKIDWDKTAKIILSELRSGNLGRISLETPADMENELAKLTLMREQKTLKKLARKEKWKNSQDNQT
jgi:ribosome biogenesis GTPase A